MNFESKASIEDIRPLAQKNIINNVKTLSLYRFWARANVREYLWGRTSLNNEPFRFAGSGNELFSGFLTATLVIFMPLWLVPQLLQLGGNLLVIGIASFVSSIAILFFLGIGIWRARAYLLSRTSWCGIRFSLAKGAIPFAIKFVFHNFLLGATFGWWHPKMRQSIAKQIWSNTYWGNLQFRYLPPPNQESLSESFAGGWFLSLIVGGFAFTLIGIVFTAFSKLIGLGSINNSPLLSALWSYISLALMWFIATLCFANYRVKVLKKITASIYIDGARMELDLDAGEFSHLTIDNAAKTLFSLGLMAPYTTTSFFALIIKHLIIDLPPGGLKEILENNDAAEVSKNAEGIDDAFELPFFDMSPV